MDPFELKKRIETMNQNKKNRSVGERLLSGMAEVTEALQKNNFEKLTVRSIKLDLVPTPYDKALVVETRSLLSVSQAVFAQFLGVSVSTIASWEQGDNKPSDMACRFMDEIRHNPSYWRDRLMDSVIGKATA